MTISSTAMRAMVAAGATAEMLIAALEADERAADVKADKRRTDAAERKRRQRQRERERSRDVTHVTDVTRDTPSPSLDGRPSPPAPPHPTLNPSPTPGSDPDGSAAAEVEQAGCGQAEDPERPDHRRELLTRGVVLVKAITGRSEVGARQLIGHLLGIARDEAVRVLAVIEDADGRELADPVGWMKRQLETSRDHGPPPGRRLYQPQPTGRAKRQLELIDEIAEEMRSGSGPDDDILVLEDQPEGSRGEDRGVSWTSGTDRRPSDPLLRAARLGAYDSRASSTLRRAKPA